MCAFKYRLPQNKTYHFIVQKKNFVCKGRRQKYRKKQGERANEIVRNEKRQGERNINIEKQREQGGNIERVSGRERNIEKIGDKFIVRARKKKGRQIRGMIVKVIV